MPQNSFLHHCLSFSGASVIFFKRYNPDIWSFVCISSYHWSILQISFFKSYLYTKFLFKRFSTVDLNQASSWASISKLWDIGCAMSTLHIFLSANSFLHYRMRKLVFHIWSSSGLLLIDDLQIAGCGMLDAIFPQIVSRISTSSFMQSIFRKLSSAPSI